MFNETAGSSAGSDSAPLGEGNGRPRRTARAHQTAATSAGRGRALVEKFDTEFKSDFSAKSPNFRGLVLFCIEADFAPKYAFFRIF